MTEAEERELDIRIYGILWGYQADIIMLENTLLPPVPKTQIQESLLRLLNLKVITFDRSWTYIGGTHKRINLKRPIYKTLPYWDGVTDQPGWEENRSRY